jgi:hypothetical protein
MVYCIHHMTYLLTALLCFLVSFLASLLGAVLGIYAAFRLGALPLNQSLPKKLRDLLEAPTQKARVISPHKREQSDLSSFERDTI